MLMLHLLPPLCCKFSGDQSMLLSSWRTWPWLEYGPPPLPFVPSHSTAHPPLPTTPYLSQMAAPTPTKGGTYVALEDYAPKTKGEMELVKGERVKIVKASKDDNK